MNEIDKMDDDPLLPTVTASEAKQSFGQLIMDVQREPVQISKSGRQGDVLIFLKTPDTGCSELDAIWSVLAESCGSCWLI